ncbi:MAG: hypothetical protein JXD23_03535 [Spirochaetales bacterium]|nr:hypothetical protein [Spirochaetales bacterium]
MPIERNALSGEQKVITRLLAVSFFVLTLFLFAPARLYTGNFMEFTSLFHDSMLFFLVLSLGLIAALFIAVSLFARRARADRTAVAILFSAGFLMWFQGNVLPWQYGLLNGMDIAWGALLPYGIVNTLFWSILIVPAAAKAGLVVRFAGAVSLILIAAQLLPAAYGWAAPPDARDFKAQAQTADADALYRYSSRVNVAVLVLDTFQTDIFQDIILKDGDLRDSFEGFTYFRNSLTGSDGTIVSVPNMLTGALYDNSAPYLDFVRSSFLGNSLPKTLAEYGFSVELYPIVPYSVYRDFSGVKTTGKKMWSWNAFVREQAFLADLAMFRCAPFLAKPLIWNRQQWLLSPLVERIQRPRRAGNEARAPGDGGLRYAKEYENAVKLSPFLRDPHFIRQMVSSSAVMKDTDTFRFYHLSGLHLQLVMDENLERAALRPRRADMLRQGAGVLKIAAMFLDRLRHLGVYDNSLIFIVADHGSGVGDAKVNISPLAAGFNTRGPYRGNFESFKSAGLPLILVKRINAAGPLRTSDAPVCLGDIPATVADELGLEAEFPGTSMFRLKDKEPRERIYRAFVGPQNDVEYLAPLYEYAVNGFSWDDESWSETGKVYYAGGK